MIEFTYESASDIVRCAHCHSDTLVRLARKFLVENSELSKLDKLAKELGQWKKPAPILPNR